MTPAPDSVDVPARNPRAEQLDGAPLQMWAQRVDGGEWVHLGDTVGVLDEGGWLKADELRDKVYALEAAAGGRHLFRRACLTRGEDRNIELTVWF